MFAAADRDVLESSSRQIQEQINDLQNVSVLAMDIHTYIPASLHSVPMPRHVVVSLSPRLFVVYTVEPVYNGHPRDHKKRLF